MPEKDYIEREAAINEQKRFRGYLDDDMLNRLEIATKRIPAADVRPNIPGKWIRENNPSYSPFDDSSEYRYRCSQCEEYNCRESAFCPDCGAPMRGGEQDA